MKIAFWGMYEPLCSRNAVFTKLDFGGRMDDSVVKKFVDLREEALARGLSLDSLDLFPDPADADCFLFAGFPRMKNPLVRRAFDSGKPAFLILEECQVITGSGWDPKEHSLFEKIFTWHDGLVDNKKYFKTNFYYIEKSPIPRDLTQKSKLCVVIAGNKISDHPLELYSARREAVRWFERNHPEDLDLFGHDWDSHPFPMNRPLIGLLNSRRLSGFRKAVARLVDSPYSSWRGPAAAKRPLLQKYWFSLAYENGRDIPGYIFEKMFDCFFAGTVPVYWGAGNVTEHIPEDCFIDRRAFKDYESLYRRMKEMRPAEYLGYLDRAEAFLRSEKAHPFSSEYFSATVLGEIQKTLTGPTAGA